MNFESRRIGQSLFTCSAFRASEAPRSRTFSGARAILVPLSVFVIFSLVLAGSGIGSTAAESDSVSTSETDLASTPDVTDTTAVTGEKSAPEDSVEIAETPVDGTLDSLRALGILDEMAQQVWLGPVRYSTDYRLNRTTSNWNQNINFAFSARGVSVSTSTSGTIYADTETKSDRRDGRSQMSINYAPTRELSVGLDFNLSRHMDNFLNKQYDSDEIGARASYSWEPSQQFSARVTATAGSVNETKPTYTGSGTTSMLMLDSNYAFAFPCTLSVNASGQLGHKRSQDISTALKTQDQDLNETLQATLRFIPRKGTSVRFGFGKTDRRLQYPFFGEQETWDSKNTTVETAFGVNFLNDGSLSAEARYDDTQTDYAVDRTRSNSYLSKKLSASLNGPSVVGIRFNSKLDVENANVLTGTGRDGDIDTRILSARIERRLSNLISADAGASISLTQYYFYDTASIPDERDIYKDAVSFSLKLGRSGARAGGSATVKRDIQKMLYVRSKNSGNNRTNELYSASASFFCRWGNVSFTQGASSTSDYTLFHFSEEQNMLSRTTSISSVIVCPWGGRNSFRLAHVYRIQDSGSYVAPEGSDQEVYVRSGGSVTEELSLRTSHNLTPDMSFSLGQRYQQTRSFLFAAGRKKWSTGSKVLELLSDFGFTYKLDPQSTANFSVLRTYSAYGVSYWNASASFSREFF
jgi:hypothetical protein